VWCSFPYLSSSGRKYILTPIVRIHFLNFSLAHSKSVGLQGFQGNSTRLTFDGGIRARNWELELRFLNSSILLCLGWKTKIASRIPWYFF
jgi:hypothetical protein